MKKLILCALSSIIILCAPLLASCTAECGHDHLTAVDVAPTCGEEGYTLNTCTECNAEFKTNYKLPTGHMLTETVFSPTCESEGYTLYTCVCGYSFRSSALPPAGHSYKTETVAATCSAAGYTEYLCTVCEHTYRANYVSATGHDMRPSVYAPTTDSAGHTEYTCSVCKYSYITDISFYRDAYGGGYVSSDVIAKGIDVSKWQHTLNSDGTYKPLDWSAIKAAGIDFVILRAGYTGSGSGSINIDPVFEMDYRDAKAAGLMVGAYYYSVAINEKKLNNEINALLGILRGKQFEYPIYLDVEDEQMAKEEQREALTRLCLTYINIMRENGYYGAIYANQNWLNNYLYRKTLEGYCDVWYAHYTSATSVTVGDEFVWDHEKFGKQLGMWQYTNKGLIENSGIDKMSTVDMNYSYKDYPTIIRKYGLNGFINDDLVKRAFIA